MLVLVQLSTGIHVRISAVTPQVEQVADFLHLGPRQRSALFAIVRSPTPITISVDDLGKLIELVAHPRIRAAPALVYDERGNNRRFTLIETYLSLNPFFTEAYALDELDKVMAFALRTGILEPSYAALQLTFHDVPPEARGSWTNARSFIGDELYPRLAKTYYLQDRAINKVYSRNPEARRSYLHYRRRFLEPTDATGPSHRGRREIVPSRALTFDRYGIMSPSMDHAVGLPRFTPPVGLERRRPGKLMFLPPSWHDEARQNRVELRRRELDFPFVAGPSGSMAYDLAVYHFYLVHALELDPDSEEFASAMLPFVISRAIAYVKYGHHSFYEALIPAQDLIGGNRFESPLALYKFVVPYIEMGVRSGGTYSRAITRIKPAPLAVHWDSYAYDWLDWRSYKPDNYQQWTIRRTVGGPLGLNGEPIAAGRYIYVVLARDRSVRYLPTHPDTREQYRSHSQLAGGLSVYAAGYFELRDDNVLAHIDNSSGHYKPGPVTVLYACTRMRELGFDTSATDLNAHVLTDEDRRLIPWVIQQIKTTGRILISDLRTITGRPKPGRTRSFPTPPERLARDMPY